MPETPDSPSFVSGFRVRSYELDGLGHVNHAVYLNYLEQARFDALASGGFPLQVMEAEGWAVHVVRIEVDYRSECRFEDQLLVTTRVLELRNSSMTLGQKIHCLRGPARPVPPLLGPIGTPPELPADPPLAVEARIVAVWVGPSGRPIRIPGEVRSALAG
jgi:YbgC/YbaW family acyl-CoA thioester hydrolase